jgi:hypothetical protein
VVELLLNQIVKNAAIAFTILLALK